MCFDKILAGGRTPFKSKGFVTQFTKPFVAVTASHGLQICIKWLVSQQRDRRCAEQHEKKGVKEKEGFLWDAARSF